VFEEPTSHSMAGFMVCHSGPLLSRQQPLLLLQSSNDPFYRLLKVKQVDSSLLFSRSDKCSFVAHVGYIGTYRFVEGE